MKHYLSAPTHEEKEAYSKALHNYGKQQKLAPKPKPPTTSHVPEQLGNIPEKNAVTPKQKEMLILKENVPLEICVVPMYPDNNDSNTSTEVTPQCQNHLQNVVNNQLRQASNMFQNATFQNCQFSFNLPN